MVCLGRTWSAFKTRAASSTVATPAPLSFASWAAVKRIFNVQTYFHGSLGQQSPEQCCIFSRNGQNWQRSSGIESKRRRVQHAVWLVRNNEHGRRTGLRHLPRNHEA